MNSPAEAATSAELARARAALGDAHALLITAGAGMGVDSGLPDFRGSEGFWRAYPACRTLGLRFEQLANPTWFRSDPELAWGFYGHRRNLYRRTVPHDGFHVLRRWAENMRDAWFVFTSNVDGQFQAGGFDAERIVECHGSILFDQCSVPCCDDVWPADADEVAVDEDTLRARGPLPRCRHCGETARPNVLMFGDGDWVPHRTDEQYRRYREWLHTVAGERLVVIECGAGTGVPTVRMQSERVAGAHGGRLVRINVREPQVGSSTRDVSLAMGARAALLAMDEAGP
jgi:NAD-dependent SIR2 family protein deacetylase